MQSDLESLAIRFSDPRLIQERVLIALGEVANEMIFSASARSPYKTGFLSASHYAVAWNQTGSKSVDVFGTRAPKESWSGKSMTSPDRGGSDTSGITLQARASYANYRYYGIKWMSGDQWLKPKDAEISSLGKKLELAFVEALDDN